MNFQTKDGKLLKTKTGLLLAQEGGGGGDIDKLIDGSLTEITSNVSTVGAYSFYGKGSLINANFPKATKVLGYAFQNCGNLTTVNFPLLTNIAGSSTFKTCKKLQSIDFPLATTTGGYTFQDCTALLNANFPSATVIGSDAFNNCTALITADIPLATSIGIRAFNYCQKITTANFPNATSIGAQAFYVCRELTTANLPSATSVPSMAFSTCNSLIKVILGTKQTTVATLANTNAFSYCYHILGTVNSTYNPDGLKDGYIYTPASLVADYRVATNWATYASQIMPWVATVEELANIDGTTYDHACVGEGVDGVEYAYNGTTWEVFIR